MTFNNSESLMCFVSTLCAVTKNFNPYNNVPLQQKAQGLATQQMALEALLILGYSTLAKGIVSLTSGDNVLSGQASRQGL